jgi:hypothetical protein
MTLRSGLEVDSTREKRRLLERTYAEARDEATADVPTRELTLWSLKRLMNQFTEEIARYEAHASQS